MRNLRTGTPQPEMWDAGDIMSHLNIDKQTAERIMDDYRKRHGIKGYDVIEKHLILDFINEKQREEREREARHNADLAITRQIAILEEQVKTLKEQNKTLKQQFETLKEMSYASSADAQKARTQSLIANFISGISIAVAILALVLN